MANASVADQIVEHNTKRNNEVGQNNINTVG